MVRNDAGPRVRARLLGRGVESLLHVRARVGDPRAPRVAGLVAGQRAEAGGVGAHLALLRGHRIFLHGGGRDVVPHATLEVLRQGSRALHHHHAILLRAYV